MGRASQRKKQERRADEERVTYGYYLVAFFDLVGQTSELRRLQGLPHDGQYFEEVISALRRTAGRVRTVRTAFEDMLASASRPIAIHPDIAQEYRRRLQAIATPKFTLRGFSDSFVITTPLFGEGDDPVRAIRDIFAILFGVTGMALVSMGQGKAIRGGIDVERGIEIYPNEVYGPGLLSAYELESKEAQYPRIVIGPGLCRYVATIKAIQTADPWLSYARTLANETELLTCDAPDDGKKMAHMLSPTLLELGGPVKDAGAKAYAWAKSEHARFEGEGAMKLESYYRRLVQYFNAFGFVD